MRKAASEGVGQELNERVRDFFASSLPEERANSNGKWQMAKFKWFAIWELSNRKPFTI
jgi:hypothetical protein